MATSQDPRKQQAAAAKKQQAAKKKKAAAKKQKQQAKKSRKITKNRTVAQQKNVQAMTAGTGRYNTATSSEEVLREHARVAKGKGKKKKYKINYKRFIPFCLAVLLIIVGLIFGVRAIVTHNSGNSDKSKKADTSVSEEVTETTTKFTFSAVGDNLIHQRLYEQAASRAEGDGYDFTYCYKDFKEYWAKYDVNWVNQESLANNKLAASSYPTFSTPEECVQALYAAGVRVFSLANNHTYDKGSTGLDAAIDMYENDIGDDICYTGIWEKDKTDYIPIYEYNGVKIAFLSYAEMTNGISTPEDGTKRVIYTSETDLIKSQVEKASKKADVVIVGCHWGTEDSHTIIESQTTLAQNLADWGADLIIGTHPHVVQNAQWLTAADGHKAFVAYSLGNFLSTQATPDEVLGLALSCTFEVTQKSDGTSTCEVKDPKLTPTVTMYGSNASSCHVELLENCTASDLTSHGVCAKYPGFSYSYACKLFQRYVDSEFLVLPKAYTDSLTTTAASDEEKGTASATTTNAATEVAAGTKTAEKGSAVAEASTAAVIGDSAA